MRIACSSWRFQREIPRSMSPADFAAWCGSQGIFDVEFAESHIAALSQEALVQLKRACDSAGVRVACLAITNDFTLPDATRLIREVERVRFLLYDVAKLLGATLVRMTIGTADSSHGGDQRALETFRGLRPDLEATGITLAIENHNRVQTTAGQTEAIVVGVGSPQVGSCLDLGSLPADRRELDLSTLAPTARYVHARSYAFTPQGEETTIDYQRALAILTEHGYDDVIAIDYDGAGDSTAGVLATHALIQRWWEYPATGRKAA